MKPDEKENRNRLNKLFPAGKPSRSFQRNNPGEVCVGCGALAVKRCNATNCCKAPICEICKHDWKVPGLHGKK